VPTPDRLFHVEARSARVRPFEEVYDASGIDPWFLDRIVEIIEMRRRSRPTRARCGTPSASLLRRADRVPHRLEARAAAAVYKGVDTCAAEFEAYTPYYLLDLRGRGRSRAEPATP